MDKQNDVGRRRGWDGCAGFKKTRSAMWGEFQKDRANLSEGKGGEDMG